MNHLLQKYPDGVFPVLEVAKAIGMEASAVRRKLSSMNGVVNYDRDRDTLNVEQLRLLLPEYITGSRQLKGQKRKAVETLLAEIGGDVNILDIAPVRMAGNRPVNREKKPDNAPAKDTDNMPADGGQNQLKESFLTNQKFLLCVVAGLVLVQSSHFALYYIGRVGEGGLTHWLTVCYGILIGLLVEAMGLILVANGRGKKWLAVIAFVSLAVNCLFYEVYRESGADLIGEFLLAAVIPGCIYMVSELYVDKAR